MRSWALICLPDWCNIPNLLSLSRLFLAPVAVWAIVSANYSLALLIFFIAGVTDGLDGWLARRLGKITRFGAYIDPIADKALLSAVFVALGIAGLAPWWVVWLVFGRDLLILCMAGAGLLLTRERNFPPSLWGKISTAVQILTVISLIAIRLVSPARAGAWTGWLLFPAVVFTVWSGLDYARRGIAILQKSRSEDARKPI
jgi:cardiolipin synthase (CMP-forming)